MRDVFSVVAEWLASERPCALATLAALREAKTAPLGTTIAIDDRGHIVGNIGAGCFEGDIVEAAQSTLADGAVRRLHVNLDTADDLAGTSGCGAALDLIVWRPTSSFLATARAIARGQHDVELVIEDFAHTIAARTPLVLIGATALAADLSTIAHRAEFFVTVVDPRPLFATRERIPDADAIVPQWPDEILPGLLGDQSAIVVLSHDPKFDLPALRCALRSRASYIGLLGSRRAQAARRDALRSEGFSDTDLARIHGPVGLNIGGEGPGETAISILAEIVAHRHGRSGTPLLAAEGAIH
jgi:xanthine dehydrogenase accessory factor